MLAKSVEDQVVIEKLRAALGVAKLENEALRKEISLLQTRAQVASGFWFTKRRWPKSCAMLLMLQSLRTRCLLKKIPSSSYSSGMHDGRL